jgi:solute carrier family 31 (copper transporter), member 1
MDHGGHGGHQMGPKCSMNMLWYEFTTFISACFSWLLLRNTQIIDTCVVFRQWHISSNLSFVVSCFAIILLGIFYEYLREIQKSLDRRIALSLISAKGKGRLRSSASSGRSSPDSEILEEAGLLNGRKVSKSTSSG